MSMTFPVTYQIQDGNIQVTASKEGFNYNFDLKYADGRSRSFGYVEEVPNKISLTRPVTERCEYDAMIAFWQLQIN